MIIMIVLLNGMPLLLSRSYNSSYGYFEDRNKKNTLLISVF
jgi:hypothetical protein